MTSRLKKAGRLRKLAPRLYTTNLADPPEDIVTRNLWPIVAALVPGGVVSHRTALDLKPTDGTLFLTARIAGRHRLPGLTIVRIAGPGPLDGDAPFIDGLFTASYARAFLENLKPSRARETVAKSTGRKNVEERLTGLAARDPPEALNRIRDAARHIAPMLDAAEEFARLDETIGALQRTREVRLAAPNAIALAAGRGTDPRRTRLFTALYAALRELAPADRPLPARDGPAFLNAAFYDAYFSNYIEGTRFEVGEAIRIVFDRVIPERRPADAHDVLGTFKIVGSLDEMTRRAGSFEEFRDLMCHRHATMMAGRPEVRPGRFKDQANQVGTVTFVAPNLVDGTLREAWNLLTSIERPFARALFTMFMVAEVHPFDDGNGRIARAMMNAELIAGGQCRLFIPSVYRNEHVGSLRLLTNHENPDAFLRVMDVAQDFVSRIDYADRDAAKAVLSASNAFADPANDVRLIMPERPRATS